MLCRSDAALQLTGLECAPTLVHVVSERRSDAAPKLTGWGVLCRSDAAPQLTGLECALTLVHAASALSITSSRKPDVETMNRVVTLD